MRLSPAELETKAANAIRGGFVTVSVAGIKRELAQDAWISEVAVRRVWPDSLSIHVTEHEPVALWGSSGLISSEAAVFSPPQESFPPGLPFLNGPRGSEAVVLEKYRFLQTELARRGHGNRRPRADTKEGLAVQARGRPCRPAGQEGR